MPASSTPSDGAIRRRVIDWLDDNYHFGDAEALLGGDDEKSFLDHGILDSLGFVKLVLFLEDTFHLTIDRQQLSRANFDGLGKIVRYVESHPQYRAA